MGWFNGKITRENPTGWLMNQNQIIKPTAQLLAAAKALNTAPAPGYTMPAYYLVPLTRAQINEHMTVFYTKQYDIECRQKKIKFCEVYVDALGVIELFNLAYVNGFTTWENLQWAYQQSAKLIEGVPQALPNLKTQLKNAGKVVVSAVAGLIAAGPVGLFTGIASATASIVSEERLKKAQETQKALEKVNISQSMQAATSTTQVREEIAQEQAQQEQQKNILGVLALILGGGILIYALKD